MKVMLLLTHPQEIVAIVLDTILQDGVVGGGLQGHDGSLGVTELGNVSEIQATCSAINYLELANTA